jgi:hypothetical protein
MALGTAIGVGTVAGLALPFLFRDQTGQIAELLSGRVVRIPLGGDVSLHWSWLAFCVVTLAAWALLAVAQRD